MIIWVSGAMRTAAFMRECVGGIGHPRDNHFWGLPGHGDEPLTEEISLASWSAALAAFVRRQAGPGGACHLVGESLGGTLALAVAGMGLAQVKSVVTVDAPLTMAKQWALQRYLRTIGRERPELAFFHAMSEGIFGIRPDGTQAERNHYPLLDRLPPASATRVLALCSDLPLWPAEGRPIEPMPSTNDEVDRDLLARAGVEVRVLSGPHNLLDASTAACMAAIEGWVGGPSK